MTPTGLTVIFRTQSDIEANVVEALLDSHGVQTMRTAGPRNPRSRRIAYCHVASTLLGQMRPTSAPIPRNVRFS